MKSILESFLKSLNDTDPVMEAVMDGFSAIFEGYADVVEAERPDALSRYKQMAANTAMGQGNYALAFLQNSSARLNEMYSYGDDEPELDSFTATSYYEPTSDDDVNNVYISGGKKSFRATEEDSFGLTARDIAYNKDDDDDSWVNSRWSDSSSDWDDLAD